jgi:hypothetical protein
MACLLLLIQWKWIKIGYKASNNQWFTFGFIMLLFIFSRLGEDWGFLKIDLDKPLVVWQWQCFFEQSREYGKWYSFIFDIKLIDVLWLSICYPLFVIIRKIYGMVYRLFKKFRLTKAYQFISKKYNVNVESLQNINSKIKGDFFEEDIPLKAAKAKSNSSNIESQQYKELTDILVSKLKCQKFEKAFSIGVIGPYGNGKSSFVNHLRDKFENQLSSNRFELIEFLPAYSHRPEQIITDFFSLLASKLKKYHGGLNQSMLAYAAKLLELGFNGKKDIQGLLKPTDWFTENKSASQAYEDLKDIFTQIDIKTIVIIDDVDRLGKDEIFEVLRIIRNTANFPNTIFLVAYDKDYVAKTIERDLMYLDKYFQYEMFVPPHRSEDLIESFSTIVLQKDFKNEKQKELSKQKREYLETAMKISVLNISLLDKFIFNYRDVKVISNAYCMNLMLLSGEVDCIDLLHFTLLNKNFPKQVRYIYDNSIRIFEEKPNSRGDFAGIGQIQLLEAKGNRTALTIDDLLAEPVMQEMKDRSDLFKDLFEFLFKLKKRSIGLPNDDFNKQNSIINIEKTHLYFELLIRRDEISTMQFALMLGITTDLFRAYINKLISDQEGDNKKIEMKKKIQTKLEFFEKDFDTKNSIKNAIWACHHVNNSYSKSNLVDLLNRNIIVNYSNALANIFDGKVEKFADFFKTNLWDNPDIRLEYKIVAILNLSAEVDHCISNDASREGEPTYLGSSKKQIKEILILQTKEYIEKVDLKYGSALNCISNVLDSELVVSDADIGFSDYLYSNEKRLIEYLEVVGQDYTDACKFRSAIFKVFTDINKFEEECFDKFPKHKRLIREFHHLLELHDIRKEDDNLASFTPFYFSANRDLRDSLSDPVIQTIYVRDEWGSYINTIAKVTDPNNMIQVYYGGKSTYIIEGKHSYRQLMMKFIPESKQGDSAEFLNKNHDVEIISIQTPEQIDESLLPYIKYYKTLNDETITPVV